MATTIAAQPQEKQPVIVGFKIQPNANLITAQGGEVKFQYTIIPAIACNLPTQAITALAKNPHIAYIEQDIEVFALADELDNSWGVKRIGAGTVHASGNRGDEIKVAILDTGINYKHEELKYTILPDGKSRGYQGGCDYVNNDNDPWDDNGHGTHCAGIIAAADDDNNVLVGVAPNAHLYSVKVLDSQGSGLLSTVILGIQWAVDHEMQVISMSLGASSDAEGLQDACDNAVKEGIVVVAAAGNSGPARGRTISTVGYPAKYPSVIAVGATTSTNALASYSSTGPEVELVAPGSYILSTYIDVSPNDNRNIDTLTMSGTSMACPHVAGTAALILNTDEKTWSPLGYTDGNGIWSSAEVRKVLIMTADDLGTSGKDNLYGYGLVDADEAAPQPSIDTTPPTISALTPANGAFINDVTPQISATVTDPSGINWDAVTMTLDGSGEGQGYDTTTNVVSYTLTTATALSEGSHTVVLTAIDTKGNSITKDWSFTVDITDPDPVTGLTATAMSSSQIDLSWDPVDGAAKYNIYRDGIIAPIAQIDQTDPPSAMSYSDTGLSASTEYTYTVSAVDLAGNELTKTELAQTSAKTLEAPAQELHVKSIEMSYGTQRIRAITNVWGIATITIVDDSGNPVSGVTVKGIWSGVATDTDSGTTNSAGQVTFTSNQVRKSSNQLFTLTIENVALNGWTYNPSLNVENSDSITIK